MKSEYICENSSLYLLFSLFSSGPSYIILSSIILFYVILYWEVTNLANTKEHRPGATCIALSIPYLSLHLYNKIFDNIM